MSNADPDQIRAAHAVLGDALASVQNQFSPKFRSSKPEIDVCDELGLAFLPWLWPAIRELWLRHRVLLLASAAAGLALAALPSTTTDQAAGRYSGFWGPLATVPTVLGRTNPAFLLA